MKKEDIELIEKKDCIIEAIITLSINEWNNNKHPQAVIEEWEIHEINKNMEINWMDSF